MYSFYCLNQDLQDYEIAEAEAAAEIAKAQASAEIAKAEVPVKVAETEAAAEVIKAMAAATTEQELIRSAAIVAAMQVLAEIE